MSPAKKLPASKKLDALRRKYSDQIVTRKEQRLNHVQTLGYGQGAKFHTTREKMTPLRYRTAFGALYSFFFLEMSLLVVWIAYRALVQMPVWFDEGVAKALVFGLPVFWFAARSKFVANELGLDPRRMLPGLYLGLAVGGLYGFMGILTEVFSGRQVAAANLFASSGFWWLAFLALLTAWWESLFFYGLPIQYIRSVAPWFSEILIAAFTVVLFLLFHAPLRLLTAGYSPFFLVQMGVLLLFAVGQYILYSRTKNMYSLVLSHLLWGLVIEIYSRPV
jgi:hypothetical protein